MNSGIIGTGMLGSAAVMSSPSWQVIALVIAGMGAVGWFIKHQQSEIRRLTERLDDAKERSEKRDVQMDTLKEEIFKLKNNICNDQNK